MPSSIECIVLGLLNDGCRYGHELDKAYKQRNMVLWTQSTRAAMYQALNRIEKKGWANVSLEKEGNFPERKIYTLTPAGQEALQDMIQQGLAASELLEFKVCEYLSFCDCLPLAEAIGQLKKRQTDRKVILNALPEVTEAEGSDSHIPKNKLLIKKYNLKLVRGYYQMEIDWLDEVIADLETMLEDSLEGMSENETAEN